jgi:2-polyprenyl-6-methoxyphenol hydroxylase-like FAD-dependent oxidoreductase
LAAELARADDPSLALRRYEQLMLPFARKNQDIALKIGSGFTPETGFQVRVRRAAMRLLPYLPGSQWMMKMAMRPIRDAARDLVLPAT